MRPDDLVRMREEILRLNQVAVFQIVFRQALSGIAPGVVVRTRQILLTILNVSFPLSFSRRSSPQSDVVFTKATIISVKIQGTAGGTIDEFTG